jgi:hypothetical protein
VLRNTPSGREPVMKWLLIIVVLVVLFFVFQKVMAGRRRH